MSLKCELESQKQATVQKIKKEDMEIMNGETAKLKLENFSKNALQVGDTMPDFTLINTDNKDVNLYQLLEKSPVVVTFYRGSWCPFCNLALQTLNKTLKEVKESNAKLVAISPQTPDNSLSTKEKLELDFEVLSDKNLNVAKSLNLVFEFSPELEAVYKKSFGLDFEKLNGNDKYELPIPATYIIGQDKKIRYAFLDVDYTKRSEPSEIIEVLKSL